MGLNIFPGHNWLPDADLQECPDEPSPGGGTWTHEDARGNHVGRDENKDRTSGPVIGGVGRETRKLAVSQGGEPSCSECVYDKTGRPLIDSRRPR